MDCRAFLREWARESAAQGFRDEIYATVAGFALPASSKGDPSKPTIYLSSGMHGDETSGPAALLELLRGDFFDDRFHWLVCPILNPTGLEAGKRENAQGIDLNRDYRTCESEEVCSHIAWLKKQKTPALFVSLHEDWESSGFYYYEINLGIQGPKHSEIMEAVSSFFPPEPARIIDDHEVTEPGWIFHPEHPDIPEGWPEAIYLARMGCPLSLTFETPSGEGFEDRVGCHQAAVRQALASLAGCQ